MEDTNTSEEKNEWKRCTLVSIKENDDGTNNYSEFKLKSKFELEAAGYWKYVTGPDYNPPFIPALVPTSTVEGIDEDGNHSVITIPGNEDAVADAKRNAEKWLKNDKKALSAIVKAVPMSKMHVTRDCESAHGAWMALKSEYEPANTITALTIKQQIIGNACGEDNPVNWRETMIQLYDKLRDANPKFMTDKEFSSHLVTLMTTNRRWAFCRDTLLEKLRVGEATNHPISSSFVIQRLRMEEVNQGISPSIVSINAMVGKGKAKARNPPDVIPSAYASLPLEQRLSAPVPPNRKQNRDERRPTPYGNAISQQRPSRSKLFCENTHCETPVGHLINDCFAYQGGKQGQYPPGYRGRKDVHLPAEARTAARRKQAKDGQFKSIEMGSRFAGTAQSTNDTESNVKDVLNPLAFMLETLELRDDDEISIDEEIVVNVIAINAETTKDNGVNHDTGASRHIFHNRNLFHDYSMFENPLDVFGFGSNLSAAAIGKGKIVLNADCGGTARPFSISNVLHIPTARCNLISGSRLDKKGVKTSTGNGKITYLTSLDEPFANGTIVQDLYKMNVVPVQPEEDVTTSQSIQSNLIVSMVPSVTTLFGPGTETEANKRLGFITV
jgi:hypothetical protein